jgi:hypothetical protein
MALIVSRGTMDGRKFESLEVIVDNQHGLIVERAVAGNM